MEITPLGDSALIVRVRDRFEDAPEQTLNEVLHVLGRLARIPGVIELASAYTTVSLFFDPVAVANAVKPHQPFEWLTERVRTVAAEAGSFSSVVTLPARLVEIPVCYDAEFAFDLEHVAHHAQISPKEVIDLHSAGNYRVSCVGFTPGFPFLTGLPRKLATSRQPTPRKQIPAGSVAIGGAQTGIYPQQSPGGWNVIGRTPIQLFDPKKNPPALLCAGDRVGFRGITREEFESMKQERI
jgi:inhibitor of KinA